MAKYADGTRAIQATRSIGNTTLTDDASHSGRLAAGAPGKGAAAGTLESTPAVTLVTETTPVITPGAHTSSTRTPRT
jgi:hypothetical protein